MLNSIFDQMDFGPLQEFLDDDDVTDISYDNGGQVWLKTLSKGIYQVKRPEINNAFMEKLAFQCSNVMGKTFNMAHPFLDAESAELRMNFIHDSIATNGIAVLIRKTPAKIRLNKDKLIDEQYITEQLHDFLIKCVEGHANILVAGETGSGKTELVKYLASKTKFNEKIITIEDTLELHLDKIFPERDIVAMKTNNIASYTEALVACMRQNPIWIILAEVRSAEAVLAVRNSISSGHHLLSTIHADRASNIPLRLYSLLETSQDVNQFLTTFHRYIQIGIYVKGYFSKRLNRFQREILQVCEFYVDDENNKACSNEIYSKSMDGTITIHNPTKHLLDYLSISNVFLPEDTFGLHGEKEKKENSLEERNKYDDAHNIKHDPNAGITPEEAEEIDESVEGKSIVSNSKDDPFNMNGDNTIVSATEEQISAAKKEANNTKLNPNSLTAQAIKAASNTNGIVAGSTQSANIINAVTPQVNNQVSNIQTNNVMPNQSSVVKQVIPQSNTQITNINPNVVMPQTVNTSMNTVQNSNYVQMPVQKNYTNQTYIQNQVTPQSNINYGIQSTPGIINQDIISSNITGNIG